MDRLNPSGSSSVHLVLLVFLIGVSIVDAPRETRTLSCFDLDSEKPFNQLPLNPFLSDSTEDCLATLESRTTTFEDVRLVRLVVNKRLNRFGRYRLAIRIRVIPRWTAIYREIKVSLTCFTVFVSNRF